jgi:hypothetical protein
MLAAPYDRYLNCGLPEELASYLAHKPSRPEAAFRLPELAFNRGAFHFILINLFPDYPLDMGLFGRSVFLRTVRKSSKYHILCRIADIQLLRILDCPPMVL